MAGSNRNSRAQLKKIYITLAVMGLAGVLALALWLGAPKGAVAPLDLSHLDDAELVRLAQGVEYGDPNAPVTIMEFGDYQCPTCGFFALQTKPQADLAYVESGQAKFVFHDFPLSIHPNAFLAARAARCAGDQDAYWDYHEGLFRNQNSWASQTSPGGTFASIAGELGLDPALFEGCLDSDQHAEVVSANQALGQRLGVYETPTVFVHAGAGPPRRVAGFQFDDIRAAMESLSPGQ